MDNFFTFDFFQSGLAADGTMILPENGLSLSFAPNSNTGSSSTGPHNIPFLSSDLDLLIEPVVHAESSFCTSPGLGRLNTTLFTESHVGVTPNIDSYSFSSNTTTQNRAQQASTSSHTFNPPPYPTGFQGFEDIDSSSWSSHNFFPQISTEYVPTANPRSAFPECIIQTPTATSGATYPPTIDQASSSRHQSQLLTNYGEYTSADVADGYPSTSSTGNAPTSVQCDRYANIVHGGIWYADTDPSAQVAKTLTRVDNKDNKRKQQLIPTLESVEQLVPYFHPGSHTSLPGSSSSSFHSYIGEEETHIGGSTQWTLNREAGSGGDPVEPFAGPTHRDGGMKSHRSITHNGDRKVASASTYSRKRRLLTVDNDEYAQRTFHCSSQYLNSISSLLTLFQQPILARRETSPKKVATGRPKGR
ncbi:hypothetical protein JR316_0007560 [Psilocybe cubensis]|uniref:Uncharacterized protein n=2 Tax=Psilocybe cubensis TaxID=181762 RepID=A0A8H8CGS3_PSICU|nr:hypothetical protein JR316_0007560 [Psilocybe cubensis]KAH9480953.1 hypothetical protein JR316_0007560 [Psilocybe cubensis]